MAEYIDKRQVIAAVKRWGQQRLYLPIDFREMLESIPTADVRPVVWGKWSVAIGYDPKRAFLCDQCQRMNFEPSNFCPVCGADMRGESDG